MTTRIYLDLLRVIRRKLEEKREIAIGTELADLGGGSMRLTIWDTKRAGAFGEAIALIDEALAELRKGE